MKYAIRLFSLLSFSFFTTLTMAQQELSFDEMFNNLSASRGETGGSGGTTLSGGNSGGVGGGGDTLSIGLDWAKETKVLPENYTIKWTGPDDATDYTVLLSENNFRKTTVMEVNVKDNSFTIPFGALNLNESQSYFVQIKSGDRHKSKKGVITLGSYDDYKSAIAQVKADERYANGSNLDKMMMKAWALEQSGMVMNAYNYYNKYMQDDKDDRTLRKMKTIFLRKHR